MQVKLSTKALANNCKHQSKLITLVICVYMSGNQKYLCYIKKRNLVLRCCCTCEGGRIVTVTLLSFCLRYLQVEFGKLLVKMNYLGVAQLVMYV